MIKYKIKKEKVEELKNGKTVRNIAKNLDLTENHVGGIFTGRNLCTKSIALCLIYYSKDLYKEDVSSMEKRIDYFFEKIQK